jgi:phosphoribosylglycinamide formyltransferase-1
LTTITELAAQTRFSVKRIAIFGSGSGTNAEAIISYFQNRSDVEVSLILSNKLDAYILKRAEKHHIDAIVLNRKQFYAEDSICDLLNDREIDLIVLAGFLWLVPNAIVTAFKGSIINIHPALLPNYGGKGMFGQHVHNSVLAQHDYCSGITIHFVNERYDEGQIIFQRAVQVVHDDSPDTLAQRIHQLEHCYYPKVISKVLTSRE